MKIILDTNVFVSGIFFSGPPYEIIKAWRDGKLKLVISPQILDEYRRVAIALAEQYPKIDLARIIELVTIKAEMVNPENFHEPVCVDPDDDKFLECALASKCKLIVSGDKHLLNVTGFRKIIVMKPRQFVDKYLTPAK